LAKLLSGVVAETAAGGVLVRAPLRKTGVMGILFIGLAFILAIIGFPCKKNNIEISLLCQISKHFFRLT
jgi:hypothetical protein